ncbi:NACHT domain-containing protein [Pleurocapsales cyanobacterium LEGE 06147]|nr:NACHT domain-containing protein [Pleurocapsales cyanobacterium LEGE 06147]
MKFEDRLFPEAGLSWDLERLYGKLTEAKQIATLKTARLTSVEKAILRGLLCSYSPKEIAAHLHWTLSSLRVELTRGLYRYIETLTAHDLNAIKNWRDIVRWLEETEYKIPQSKQDWSEAPEIFSFYGREKELAQLEKKIIQDKYRLITMLGMGGIGKTALAVKFAQKNKQEFQYIIWRSLRHAPLLKELLRDLLGFFSNSNLPTTIQEQISLLIEYLRFSRCLLILDNLEALLDVNHLAGFYKEKYSNYSQLIRRVAEETHQSCLLLTSQDEPVDLLFIRANKVESLQIGSLEDAAKEILKEKGLSNSNCWQKLIERYQGNPLALKLVSATIQELFGGSVVKFLEANTELGVIVPSFFQELLTEQFERLSNLEQEIMYALAINRQPISLKQLQEHFKPQVGSSKLLHTLTSLKRRSLIEVISEVNQTSFTLQPMVMKYILTEEKDRAISLSIARE